jgi:Phage integrase family
VDSAERCLRCICCVRPTCLSGSSTGELCPAASYSDWIFASPVQLGRLPASYPHVLQSFQAAAAEAGIGPVSTHSMRHTYRSWLDACGTSFAVQQKMMRHADISTTMRYGQCRHQRDGCSKREGCPNGTQSVTGFQSGFTRPQVIERMAERVGFEPTIPVKVCPLSRRIVSTTHAPLRWDENFERTCHWLDI